MGDAGPWSKGSHPQRWWRGGSRPCSSENTTMKTSLFPKVIILEKINTKTGNKRTAVRNQWKQDCSTTILSRSWTPKIWATLPAFYPLLIRLYPPSGSEATEFWRLTSLLISVLDRTAAIRNLTFGSRFGWNSESTEYHHGRKLSQLSDGSFYDSKWSAVSMLRLSEVGRIAEIEKFWTDLTFQHKSGFWWNFAMTSPETLYTKNVVKELSFLLVTHTTCFDIRFGR